MADNINEDLSLDEFIIGHLEC